MNKTKFVLTSVLIATFLVLYHVVYSLLLNYHGSINIIGNISITHICSWGLTVYVLISIGTEFLILWKYFKNEKNRYWLTITWIVFYPIITFFLYKTVPPLNNEPPISPGYVFIVIFLFFIYPFIIALQLLAIDHLKRHNMGK